MNVPDNRPDLAQGLLTQNYLADAGLTTALFLALNLREPLLLEGEPGVGKTAAAKALADVLGGPFHRLQCYEGISAAEALYEWNYAQQLLAIRLAESGDDAVSAADLFTEDYLTERPLMRALRHRGPEPAVLLVDEIDRADDEFEALLFEFLGERTITVPELGTVRATCEPVVILTSNRTRELHDALKRRCLYHWIEVPSLERTVEIVRRQVPSAGEALVAAASAFALDVRALPLDKAPGVAEVINWVSALQALGITNLSASSDAADSSDAVDDDLFASLGSLLKTPDDLQQVRAATEAGDLIIG